MAQVVAVLVVFITLVLELDILTVVPVVSVAVCHIVGENGNIDPWGWMPVWVVVTLLGALVTTAIALWVLAGVDSGAITISAISQVLVSSKETYKEWSGHKRKKSN